MKKILTATIIALIFLFGIDISAISSFDLVIKNTIVIDPLTSRVLTKYNVGISNGIIQAITREDIAGAVELDGNGKILCPSFVDTFQRHFGDEFEAIRLKDGVTTSVYVTDQPYEKFIANDKVKISYINRILLYDITSLVEQDMSSDKKNLLNEIAKQHIDQGAAGIYYKVKNSIIPNLSSLSDKYPLYLDFKDIPETSIVPFMEAFRKSESKGSARPIHMVGINYFYNVIEDIIDYSKRDIFFTFGGFPFSYVNVKPADETLERFSQMVGKTGVDMQTKQAFEITESQKSIQNTIAVIGINTPEVVSKLIRSPQFTGETFAYYPGSVIGTSDANTFVGKLLIGENENLRTETVKTMTSLAKHIFKADNSPLSNRCMIEAGAVADLLLIDPSKLTPHSSITEYIHPSQGIVAVIRDGVIVASNGEIQSQAPKARWLKNETGEFSIIDKYSIKIKGKSKENINVLLYNNRLQIPLKQLSEYLELKYEEDSGTIYMGSLLRLEVGLKSFSVGTNKLSFDEGPLLINKDIYLNVNDLERLFENYYTIDSTASSLTFNPGDQESLLDKKTDNGSNLIFNANPLNIVLMYCLAAALIAAFIFLLNKNSTNKNKRKK